MNKTLLLIPALLLSIATQAQNQQKGFWEDPFNHPMTPQYLVIALGFFTAILVIVVALLTLRAFNMVMAQAEKEKAAAQGKTYVAAETFWTRMSRKLNATVPIEREGELDLGHNFDGIRELDNHLPPWWKWLFYATIAWGVVYFAVYHISSSLPLSHDEYALEVAAADAAKQKFLASRPEAAIDVEKLQYTQDAQIIDKGKAVFTDSNCGACHRQDGGGNTIGPNLTDQYWLHGGEIKQVYTTITQGVIEKGMPAWGRSLSPTEIRDVSFFIMSLQNSNPPNAKAPQGTLMVPQQSLQSDSVKVQASL